METFMHTPTNYYPAICLALNEEAGGLKILDYIYMEEYDMWLVDCEENGYHIHGFKLEGAFVRTCFKATKEGISWVQK